MNVLITWATNVMNAAQQAMTLQEESLISRGTLGSDWQTDEEIIEEAVVRLSNLNKVPMI